MGRAPVPAHAALHSLSEILNTSFISNTKIKLIGLLNSCDKKAETLKMPLHLLGKKSWNPYLPQNIAKIKADEEEAATRELELDRLRDEHDADVRSAKLRGARPPSTPPRIRELEQGDHASGKKRGRGDEDVHERKKRRRRAGEDDTDRDLRLARDAHNNMKRVETSVDSPNPIIDKSGHIHLFSPERNPASTGVEKNPDAERKKKKSERELGDQYTMRFSNAAGYRQNASDSPWYAGSNLHESGRKSSTNAFGDEDQGRQKRDEQRINASDPMSSMRLGQQKLKESRRHKQERRTPRTHQGSFEDVNGGSKESRSSYKRQDQSHRSHRNGHDNIDLKPLSSSHRNGHHNTDLKPLSSSLFRSTAGQSGRSN